MPSVPKEICPLKIFPGPLSQLWSWFSAGTAEGSLIIHQKLDAQRLGLVSLGDSARGQSPSSPLASTGSAARWPKEIPLASCFSASSPPFLLFLSSQVWPAPLSLAVPSLPVLGCPSAHANHFSLSFCPASPFPALSISPHICLLGSPLSSSDTVGPLTPALTLSVLLPPSRLGWWSS